MPAGRVIGWRFLWPRRARIVDWHRPQRRLQGKPSTANPTAAMNPDTHIVRTTRMGPTGPSQHRHSDFTNVTGHNCRRSPLLVSGGGSIAFGRYPRVVRCQATVVLGGAWLPWIRGRHVFRRCPGDCGSDTRASTAVGLNVFGHRRRSWPRWQVHVGRRTAGGCDDQLLCTDDFACWANQFGWWSRLKDQFLFQSPVIGSAGIRLRRDDEQTS